MREVGDSVTGASVEFITLEMGSEQLLYLAADYSLGDGVDLGQADNNQGAHLHEIKISYHPASKRPEQRFGINEDPPSASASTGSQPPDPAAAQTPWHPFCSRLDFEIAELSLNAHLSKADTENLLSIIRRCIESPEQFTLWSHKDLSEYWDLARSMTDSVSKSVRPSFTFPSFK
jgi:hypothetical protein